MGSSLWAEGCGKESQRRGQKYRPDQEGSWKEENIPKMLGSQRALSA